MSTFKDKFKKTAEILGDSVKKYAGKAGDYAKEKYGELNDAYTKAGEIEQKIEEQFSDIHSEEYEETTQDELQKNQEIQECLKAEMAKEEHSASEKAFLGLRLLGKKIQNLNYQNQAAYEKFDRMGIDDWDEDRIRRKMDATTNIFEKNILRQKLEEVRSNDEDD